jgi:hypothetical protein
VLKPPVLVPQLAYFVFPSFVVPFPAGTMLSFQSNHLPGKGMYWFLRLPPRTQFTVCLSSKPFNEITLAG